MLKEKAKITISYSIDEGKEESEVKTVKLVTNPTETDFWREIGKVLYSIPNIVYSKNRERKQLYYVDITSNYGNATIKVIGRGQFIDDDTSVIYHSKFHQMEFNSVFGLEESSFSKVYLTCLHVESARGLGNYKFYQLEQEKEKIIATYGRIGASVGEKYGIRDTRNSPNPFYHCDYWIRYYEKLQKGYIDLSHVYLTEFIANTNDIDYIDIDDNKTSFSVNKIAQDLYDRLLNYAKGVVKKNLKENIRITVGMLEESKKVFEEMKESAIEKDIKKFNKTLKYLLQISPRRILNMKELFATNENDFDDILTREETLINAMEVLKKRKDGIIDNDELQIKRINKKETFNSTIKVELATDEEVQEVKGYLNDRLQKQIVNVYKVINTEKENNFDNYCKQNNIKEIKKLWHGSINANWLSIINNGLSMSVKVANGSMFGRGIYFAPSCEKSFNYTSMRGSYWAKGNDSVAFMGLYKCAYGNPHIENSWGTYDETILKQLNKNCVHAKSGVALRNDEIIFYNENAMSMEYLVEFKSC